MNPGACRPLLLLVAASAASIACHSDANSARGVAERFLDQHYVEINLEAAKPLCTGLALQKVQAEQRLTEGQAIDESTRKPTVRYRLLEQAEENERATFVFEASIRVEGADSFVRKWIVTTRRTAGTWKVANFEEFG